MDLTITAAGWASQSSIWSPAALLLSGRGKPPTLVLIADSDRIYRMPDAHHALAATAPVGLIPSETAIAQPFRGLSWNDRGISSHLGRLGLVLRQAV